VAVGIGPLLLACRHAPPPPVDPVAQAPTGARIMSLFTDERASRVGDLVTVQIYESSRGSRRVSSVAEKTGDLSVDMKTLNAGKTGKNNLGLKTTDNYEGTSGLERKGSLMASVSAQVKDVLPNGNLLLEGHQEIRLEKSIQIISLKGIARPQDIAQGNTILSTRLADARIEYKSKREPGVHRYGLLGWLASLVF
jgi:flagellar L-ring protein precursor FlgH